MMLNSESDIQDIETVEFPAFALFEALNSESDIQDIETDDWHRILLSVTRVKQ